MSVEYDNDIMKRALATGIATEHMGRDAADETVKRARAKVPVDTGELKNSIRAEGEEAKVGGGDVDYAQLVDRGSVNNAPSHFWSEAVEEAKQDMTNEARAVLRAGKRR